MTTDQAAATGPRFYDVREVARMLKMSRMTVYRAIGSGELRAVRIRGRWLVPAKVIKAMEDAAIAEQTVDDTTSGEAFGSTPLDKATGR